MTVVKSERFDAGPCGCGHIEVEDFGDAGLGTHFKVGGGVEYRRLGNRAECERLRDLYAAAVRLLEHAEAERKPVVVHGLELRLANGKTVTISKYGDPPLQDSCLDLLNVGFLRKEAYQIVHVLGEHRLFQLLCQIDAALIWQQWCDVLNAAEKMLGERT